MTDLTRFERGGPIVFEGVPGVGKSSLVCAMAEALQERGVLAKETHDYVIRFAPPLVIDKATIDWALPRIREVFF